MLKNLFIICCLSVLSASYATPSTVVTVDLKPGELTLGEFLDQCPVVANSKPLPFVHSGIPGISLPVSFLKPAF